MAASVDLNQSSIYLLNKYFIQPVLSLNTSVSTLGSTISTFNNFSTVSSNISFMTNINASVISNTSSITTINSSIVNFSTSIATINSSITNLNSSITNLSTTISNLNISISGINTWTERNIFSHASGVTTSLLDTFTSGILSIGTSVANSINLGSASIPTNVKGTLTVGAGANTIKLNANSGLNQLLITDSPGTSGQVLTSGGAAGSLSWGAGGGGSVSLSTNNVWTGTNNFSHALGVTTSLIDTFTSGVLSIGTSVASSITLGSASIPTNVKGALTVGAGANTIQLSGNSGLNQLLLTGSSGTSGQVLTSGGAAGSLSWASGGGGVSLSGTNIWTGLNTFNSGIVSGAGLTVNGGTTIKMGNLTTIPADNTYIGFIANLTPSTGSTSITSGGTKNLFTFTLPSPGTWFIVASYEWYGGTQNTNLSLSTSSLTFNFFSIGTLYPGYYLQLALVVQSLSETTSVYTISNSQGSPFTNIRVYSTATRMA